ncbi:hypothetical protein SAIN_1095 [Streptococcus anginosus C1051]|uniref:hypothetical protein n=1 Tax=Streptococcus anginosus TaxID=1328 RepID=UPI00039083AE|nr:hypothetical protein [Streptococcus anginosus]AGU81833.1 hypothetical protein SAIN_1095 [Streptococcus anginosus C1051]
MSYFYHIVKKFIRNDYSLLSQIYAFFTIALTTIFIIITLWNIFYIIQLQNPLPNIIKLLSTLVVPFLINRTFLIISREKILELSIKLKQNTNEKDRNLLIQEIQHSLEKSIEFTKWTCGILTTLIVLGSTVFLNNYSKILDMGNSLLTKEEKLNIIKNYNPEHLQNQIIQIILTIISIILITYALIQSSTYNKRFILKILNNCNYSNIKNSNQYKKLSKLDFCKELLFLNKN